MVRAVLDRIVDKETAVILVGEQELPFYLPVDKLPEGAREGSVLRVEIEGKIISSVFIDQESEKLARARINRKMDMLRKRGRRQN